MNFESFQIRKFDGDPQNIIILPLKTKEKRKSIKFEIFLDSKTLNFNHEYYISKKKGQI